MCLLKTCFTFKAQFNICITYFFSELTLEIKLKLFHFIKKVNAHFYRTYFKNCYIHRRKHIYKTSSEQN